LNIVTKLYKKNYLTAGAHHSQRACTPGLLLWARRAGDIDRLMQQRRANAGSGALSAYVRAEILNIRKTHAALSCTTRIVRCVSLADGGLL